MTEQEFRDRLIRFMERSEAKDEQIFKLIDGHHKTLFGDDGNSGICKVLSLLEERQKWWHKGLAAVQMFLTAGMATIFIWLKYGGKP